MLESLLELSGPSAFMFVSVFITVLGFVYKVWNDLHFNKNNKVSDGDGDQHNEKILELDGRITMVERQVKEIPKSIEDLKQSIKDNDVTTNKKFDSKIEELKQMVRDNKSSSSENYNKIEKRIDVFEQKLYDLIIENYHNK